ncbi:DUF3048 domain-containing protein [Auraticoccus sp. F435]|uniref:DUF3048 domain-containing protein n=1 Tax=Auraticoccus cholistanensis TaxID=2656650 RepID=A0A6A9USS5_9ACTN|nr:DUF3048 domain-containing protein [Auraticoccus cholistanensis]MVA75741.1 DUF3048 domain-containing protein [Auraticoccus cholistanensis]
MQLDRTRKVALGAGAAVVAAAVVAGAVLLGRDGEAAVPPPAAPSSAAPSPTPSPTPTPTPTPTPDPVDPLTGGEVSDNEVFAVKIDNLAPARPQVGLGEADIVVAEEVEAGLTRLIGVFHTRFPDRVGPVRSARNTDVELLPLFGRPGLVYSGANRKVQDNVRGSDHLVAVERDSRDPSRPAPHNVVVDLAAIAESKEVGEAQDIGWRFGPREGAWESAQESGDLDVRVGGDRFTFARDGKRYQPAVNGDPYEDADSGEKVLTDNVVVLSVQNRRDDDTTSSQSIVSDTTGSGEVSISREGRTVTGTWEREDVDEPMTFTDEDGEPILLRPGRTWLVLQG